MKLCLLKKLFTKSTLSKSEKIKGGKKFVCGVGVVVGKPNSVKCFGPSLLRLWTLVQGQAFKKCYLHQNGIELTINLLVIYSRGYAGKKNGLTTAKIMLY